jgi:hypothetical protein
MNVADLFVVRFVELSERHNQMHGVDYHKPKTWIQASNKTQPQWARTQQTNWKTKIAAVRAIGQRKVYNFFGFSVGLGIKAKTNYKAQDNTSWATWNLILLEESWGPDLAWGRGRSIGGDLDVGEEGSEQTIVSLQSLHHGSVGYQHVHIWIGLAKKAQFLEMQSKTQARTRKNITKLADECIAHEYGVLQTVERQNCSWQINLTKTCLISRWLLYI